MVRGRSALAAVAVVAAAALGLCLRPTLGSAQRESGAVGRFHVDATSLAPGQFVYQTTLERDTGTSILGTRTVTIAGMQYAGSPAWLLLESRSGEGIFAIDSLVAGLGDLHPMHWSAIQGEARLGVEFRGDSAFGGTVAPVGRRTIVASVPSGTLVSAAMLETVLRLLPLQGAWEDSTLTLSVTLGGNAVLPTRLSVIGEDRIRVPAGTFDCWVVAVHADPARGLYWVTKRDPIVVRSSVDVPALGRAVDGGNAQLVNALVRIGR